jgi:excinuclease ABC subunit A
MKTYNINIIGIAKNTKQISIIKIYPKFRPALKNCNLFSHLLIFWWVNKYDSNKDRTKTLTNLSSSKNMQTGIFATRENNRPNPIKLTTIEINNIDEKNGIVEFDNVDIPDNAQIIDIKAHISVSDRVKNVIVPEWFSDLPDYIPEKKEKNNEYLVDVNIQPDELELQEKEICEIGFTKKSDGKTFIQINERHIPALAGLDNFSHIRVIWWFHRLENERFRRIMQVNPPYENAPKTGVFASRSPVRPNPIGLTTAKIVNIDFKNGIVEVVGFDAFDNTPIIDIKPYIPFFDKVKSFKVPDWFKHWPEYTIEENEFETADPNFLIPADIDRLSEFYPANPETKIKESKAISKDMKSKDIVVDNKQDCIQIIGARQNNLKNIDVAIPHKKLTVITGVSGSGKSSLAFDTLYAEGQYRYIKSLSTTARQLADQMEEPDVDQIHGLLPTIAIEQRTIVRNPRSTVGSITDIFSLLRVLFSKIGIRHCPSCGRAVKPLSAVQIANKLIKLPPGTYFNISPLNENISENLTLEFTIPDSKTIKQAEFYNKLNSSIKKAYNDGNGYISITLENGEEYRFCERNACPYCKLFFFETSPSMFNNNNPDGMCPDCEGIGKKHIVDPDIIINRPELSLLDGASPWFGELRNVKPSGNWMRAELFALADLNNVDLEKSWNELPDDFKKQVLYGSGDKVLKWSYDIKTRGRTIGFERPAQGAVNNIKRLIQQTTSPESRKRLLYFTSEKNCLTCNGEKLSTEARFIKVYNKRFPEITSMSITEIFKWLSDLYKNLKGEQFEIAKSIIKEIVERVEALMGVGLHYLTLDRSLPTLSSGEAQRIRLASQLNNELNGLIYILDEPSIGLHQKDNQDLINTLLKLKNKGNTVVVVEHDAETMKNADWLIDIGPGAGTLGGEIIAYGNPTEVMKNPKSLTGGYLSGKKKISSFSNKRRKPLNWINLYGANKNNLKSINVGFPLEVFTCVTGVSGSGKSSLIIKTLSPVLSNLLSSSLLRPDFYDKIEGVQNIDKLIMIDQSPIGRTPRSNPATYTQVFDEIREVFAKTPEAKKRKYSVSYFSFNAKEGRCETCEGYGKKRIKLYFMPDIWVTCSECNGKRYNNQTLEIKYKSKSIADVLEMDVKEAFEFFKEEEKVVKILQTLIDVGLDYIKLGQSATSLSGGEAQRIKLARELSKEDTGKTLYVLDEPTTGLHFADIQKLLDILQKLTNAGNTVIVIEHNLDVINSADWVIDLGPEGGNEGGYIIANGTPEKVMEISESYTGKFLKEFCKK